MSFVSCERFNELFYMFGNHLKSFGNFAKNVETLQVKNFELENKIDKQKIEIQNLKKKLSEVSCVLKKPTTDNNKKMEQQINQ